MISSWDESFETGNKIIDSQHRELINLLDEISDGAKSFHDIFIMFEKVMEFVTSHQLCEEELMAQVKYPIDATNVMIEQHKEFKSYLRLRILEFRHSEVQNISPIISFIVNHLKFHEFEADRNLVEWIRLQHEPSHAA